MKIELKVSKHEKTDFKTFSTFSAPEESRKMRKAQGKKDDYSRSIEKQAPGFKCLPGQTESNQKKVNLKHDEIMTQLSFGENCWFSLSLFVYHLKNSFLAFSKLSSSLVLFLKLYSMNFAVSGKVTASCKGPIVCDGQ